MASVEVPANQAVETVIPTCFNAAFAARAEALKPTLHEWFDRPTKVIRFVSDTTTYFGYTAESTASMADFELARWRKGADFILDFESHRVGFLSFRLIAEGVNIDAPARLKLTFGEVPTDVAESIEPCNTWISTSWLPIEHLTVDWMPQEVHIVRRHSFRYVRIQVLDTSPKYHVGFRDIRVRAVSAVAHSAEPSPLPTILPDLVAIDRVAIRTLRDCMQTVFEDGPRRDRRMWLGDLRLQALASYHTLQDLDLVKRCLYMFAALPRTDDSLPATLFELPELRAASDYIVDYDALFGPVVYDYVAFSGDVDTGRELWQTVLGSMKLALSHISSKHLFDCSRSKAWKFCDWVEDIELDGAMHGLVLYCCKRVNALADLLGQARPYDSIVDQMQRAAHAFIDRPNSLLISGVKAEISWTTAAWLCLSEFLPASEAKPLLLNVLNHPSAIRPLTPYAWHHVAEALALVGAEKESLELIRSYWGAMVKAGADTFWECFDPKDCRASPYGDSHNNSFCHAWSCTPCYLFRTSLKPYLQNLEGS